MHTVNSVAAALPYLEKSKSASIVIVSSVSGFEVDFAAGSYGAFKAALIHYAKIQILWIHERMNNRSDLNPFRSVEGIIRSDRF